MPKDSYMYIVILLVMLTPLFPVLLKSKCPACRKRKLEHLDTVNSKSALGAVTYITHYVCHNCSTRFEREKSGPLKVVTELSDVRQDVPKISQTAAAVTAGIPFTGER